MVLGPRRRQVACAITAAVLVMGAASAANGASRGDTPRTPTRNEGGLAPLVGTEKAGVVRGEYIVVYHKDASAKTVAAAAQGKRLRYTRALKGFAGHLSAADLNRLRHDPDVAYIEADQVLSHQRHPDPGNLGPRPHRPAQPAAERQLHLHRDRRGSHRLHHRHRACASTHTPVRRPRRQRGFDADRRRHGRRLQRPRHPRCRHGRRHHLRRRQGRHARRACGCSTARAAAPTRRSSPASTGSPANHPAGSPPSPT